MSMDGVISNYPLTESSVEKEAGNANLTVFPNFSSQSNGLQNLTSNRSEITALTNAHYRIHLAFGCFLCVLFVIGLVENILVMLAYCKNNKIKTTINTYILGLVICDIGQLFLNIPLAILANLYGHWIYGEAMCQFYGFVVTSFGISQIALLTVISVERYFIIVGQSRTRSKSLKKPQLLIAICFVYGSLCAIGPVLGWSHYSVEKYGTTCSICWEDRSAASLSFVMCLFTLGLFLPLIVIVWSYSIMAHKTYKNSTGSLALRTDGQSSKKTRKEIHLTLTVLIMIGMFIFSWSPYAVISFYTSIHGASSISPEFFIVPPIIAKSSIIWNPIIYIWRNRAFRTAVHTSLKHVTGRFRSKSESTYGISDDNNNNDNNPRRLGSSKQQVALLAVTVPRHDALIVDDHVMDVHTEDTGRTPFKHSPDIEGNC